MLSNFGKVLRKLRIDRDLKLFDLAKKMGVTSAYVSAIEGGRKPVNEAVLDKICTAMSLGNAQKEELRQAAALDAKTITIDTSRSSARQKELMFALARKFNELDEGVLEALVAQVRAKSSG